MKVVTGKKGIFIVLLISLAICKIVFLTGCANIIPPSGGPRDSLPPVLVNATPKDSTLHFKGNRITLTFNEYVDLQDVQQNLLFTPTFENVPLITAKLRTIDIKLRDSLQPNTTYVFNFGNALKDVNEGNVLRNFRYVFSTGSYLDSLQLKGRVLLAENGKVDTTLIVVLHTDLTDSAVANKRPVYVARVDSSGHFTFQNLPKDTFAIYAIGEAGIVRRYTNSSQAFAFYDTTVISGSTAPITLYAYKETAGPAKKSSTPPRTAAAPTEKRLRFTPNLNNSQQDLLSDLTLTFERPLRNFDSTKLSLSTDSIFTPVTNYTAALDTSGKVIHLKTQWKEGTLYHLIINKDFAEDTLARKLLKTDTLSFTSRKQTDYGNIKLQVRNLDTAQNPILQFVQNDLVVFSVPIKTGSFSQALFLPGDYDLRILYDKNNNGKWDPGHFFGTKKQPELVIPIKQKITIKPNWDNEFERSLQK